MILVRIKSISLNCCYYLIFLSISYCLGQITTTYEQVAKADPQNQSRALNIDHIEGPKIYFKTGANSPPPSPLDTQLFDLKPLGKLLPPEEDAAPYFLVEAKPCLNCFLEKAIYVFGARGGKPAAYTYPGRTLEPKSKQVLMESRGFFGKCIPGRGDVLLFFQLERVDRHKQLQPSVLIAEATKEHLEDTLLERHGPSLRQTLQLVKKKACSEIPGQTRTADSHSIYIHTASTSSPTKS